MRRPSAGAQTAVERRARENAAKRLHEVIPRLRGLKLHIQECEDGIADTGVSHIRYIVIDRAPAIFEVGCSDRKCNGNHDLTMEVLDALSGRVESFEGHNRCHGENKTGLCDLELHFRADASYAA